MRFPLSRAALLGHALCATLALTACGGSDDNTDPLVRKTAYGPVKGSHDSAKAAYAWLGIPYATPPVGALRWKAPTPPTAWTETRSAEAYGRSCAQPSSFYSPPVADNGFSRDIGITTDATPVPPLVGSEDCLTLNIWRPDTDEKDLPVVVWLHGGANTVGYSSNPGYNGANFARTNKAVVVTLNYRLGAFGWLRHVLLSTPGDALSNSGNFGLLDQMKAMEFVKSSIAEFGGNPGNITLMGQSAGAFDVYAHMVSPLTKDKGWFHKAVAMSGGLRTNTTAAADKYALEGVLAKLLVLTGKATAANVVSVLGSMTPQDMVTTLRTAPTALLALTSPGQADNITDGTVLPADPAAAVAAGEYRNVPLLVGLTRDENRMFMQSSYKVKDGQRFLMMYDFDPENLAAPGNAKIEDILKPDVTVQDYLAKAAATTGHTYNFVGMRNDALAKFGPRQSAVYAYQFDWAQGPEPWNTLYGAGHAMDVPFMFGNFNGKGIFSMNYNQANRAGREALSDAMLRSVGAFMRTGNPNHSGLGTAWQPWTTGSPQHLVFDATPQAAKIGMQPDN